MNTYGLMVVALAVPFLVGLAVCGAGGVWLTAKALDFMLERILHTGRMYYEFLAFVRHRAAQDRAKRGVLKGGGSTDEEWTR